MAPLLPRFTAAVQRIDDERKLARIILETGDLPAEVKRANSTATAAGDTRKLRGIPAIGRGVSGTSPGTDPAGALLRFTA